MKYLQSEYEANEAGFACASGAKVEVKKDEFMTIAADKAEKEAAEKAKAGKLGSIDDSSTWVIL